MHKFPIFILSLMVLYVPMKLEGQEQWIYYTNDNYITCLGVDKNYVWTAAPYGIYGVIRWDKKTGENKRYTIKDGLPDNMVMDIAIDKSGYKWFGTMSGLAKFDGNNWTIFGRKNGLLTDYVKIIQIAPNGEYWFGTSSGISKYTGTFWFNYTSKDGLLSTFITSIACGYGKEVWATMLKADYYYLTKFNGTIWTTYIIKDIIPVLSAENGGAISSLYLDKFGKLWIGSNKGVVVYDGKNYVQYTTENGLIGNSVMSITSEKDEKFWFGTKNGVSCFDGTNWTSYTSKDGLSSDVVGKIVIDSDGNKWFATYGGGLCSFDGTKWKTYKTNDWLPFPSVNMISVDRKGNIWLVLSSDIGVCCYDGSNATVYTTNNGLAGGNTVKTMAHDSANNTWFGYGDLGGGVSKFTGKEWINYSYNDGLASTKVNAIAIDTDESIWFGTNYGVSRFDGTNWTTYRQSDGLIYDDVRAIAFDTQGNKWFGTYVKGVSKFDGTKWTSYTKDNGLISNYITCIKTENNGNVWIGGLGGVSKFDGTNWTTYNDINGIHNALYEVSKIEIDNNGNKWFIAYGVFKYDGSTWKQYKIEDGLMGNYMTDITKDLEGNLLFAEPEGISKLIMNTPSAVDEDNKNIPSEFSLSQNYPNPFNPATIIRFQTPQAGITSIKIYNILGQEVKTVISEQLPAGTHEVKWDGTDKFGNKLASGIYIYRMETSNGYVKTRKMVFLK